MASRIAMCLMLMLAAACVSPALPGPQHPPAADRFERAADLDPLARLGAADELANDPDSRAADLLLVLQRSDVDPRVRARASLAIAARRDGSLDDALTQSAATDPDPTVRAASSAAHEKLWPWRKRPGTAAGLSVLCPGCGQLYLGDDAGYANLIATATLIVGGAALISGHTTGDLLAGPVDSAKVPIGAGMLLVGQNLWFYSIFDAYRSARVMREDAGYRHAITRETLPALASAPFRPSVLARPWVWAGVPIALGAALGISYLANRNELTGNPSIFDIHDLDVLGHRFGRAGAFAAGSGYFAALFSSVGVGEEALFRGVVQSELEERFGTTGGLALASCVFGAVHLVNYLNDPKQALIAVPVIAILGSSLGLAYQHTGYKLETSVAMHFWYDFLLSGVAFAADPQHQPFVVQYGARL